MVQLNILSGRQAGTFQVARRFPFVVGRENGADLRIEDEGVWDHHLELHLRMPEGFVLKARPSALVSVNTKPIREARLRNGDLIEIGAVKLEFGLSGTARWRLWPREILVWAGLALVCVAQVALIYAVLP